MLQNRTFFFDEVFLDLPPHNEGNRRRIRKWKDFFKKMRCFPFVRNNVIPIIITESVVSKDNY